MGHSIKVRLRRKPNKNGLYTIILQLTIDRKSTELKIDHSIQQDQFNPIKRKVVKHYRADYINQEITNSVSFLENLIFDLKRKGNHYTTNMVSELFRNRLKGNSEKNKSGLFFSNYLEDYISNNPDDLKKNTLSYYKTVLNKWIDIFPSLLLSEIEEKHLRAFDKKLKSNGLRVNTRYKNMKVLRKMLHRARRYDLINTNPFQNITLKQEKGNREYLVKEEIVRLEALTELSEIEKVVRDVFLFGVYTGLRFSDICTLNEFNFIDPLVERYKYRIKLELQKTEEYLEFHSNDKASILIDKYMNRGKNYIFPMLDKCLTPNYNLIKRIIGSKNSSFNRVLKRLIKRAEIMKPISFHCSRHTFAVLSIEKGADLYVLSKMLGHDSIVTTELYAKMVDKRKDELTDLWNEK